MKTRHQLLIYDALGRWLGGRILIGLFLVAIVIGFEWRYPFLGSFQVYIWIAGGLLLALSFYLMGWVRHTAVYVRADHLQIQGPLYSLRIPFETISTVSHTRLADHFTPELLSIDHIDWLGDLYYETCAVLRLREDPLPSRWKRRLFSSLIFSPRQNALLLLIEDWVGLTQSVEEMRRRLKKEARPANLMSGAFPNGSAPGRPSDPLLLLADDSPARLKNLERLLRERYRLVLATSGIDALRLARDNQPDLIISDLNLSGLNGLQLLLAVRKAQRLAETPFIIVADEPFPRGLEAGASDVITRPTVSDDLLARIANALRIRQQLIELKARNDNLHGQMLNQMAELVRKGELLNFLPQQVAQSVMSGYLGDSRSLKRQQVTVLFVDMVNFTELTGRLNPTVLSALVNEFLREMAAIAIAHQGTVDKFIGDEVMVLFGAPDPQEEQQQVRNATLAALNMLDAIQKLSRKWESRLPTRLNVRIGFNTGYGTAGVFGDEMLRTYTVVGSVVNIAARLRAAAAPGQIVCSSESFSFIESEFGGESLGRLELKGVNFPVEAYTIHGRVFELAP